MAKSSYVPTGSELSEAIVKELNGVEELIDAKELQAGLTREHPNWKIPERRVNKFLKRYMNQSASTDGSDEHFDVATENTAGRGRRFLNLLSGKRGNKRPTDIPESAPVDAPVEAAKEALPQKELVEEEEPIVEDLEPDPVMESRSLEQVYSDDNDGTRNDCHCDACTIM